MPVIRILSYSCRDEHSVAPARRGMGVQLPVSLTAYSVVGAAAYMGGATRMTLTTTVMVMETTGALQLIVPIMLTVFVAKARQCSTSQPSFYLILRGPNARTTALNTEHNLASHPVHWVLCV